MYLFGMVTNYVAFSRPNLVAAADLPAMGSVPASCGVFTLPLSMSRLSHLQAKALPLASSCQLKQQCVLSAAGSDLRQ